MQHSESFNQMYPIQWDGPIRCLYLFLMNNVGGSMNPLEKSSGNISLYHLRYLDLASVRVR